MTPIAMSMKQEMGSSYPTAPQGCVAVPQEHVRLGEVVATPCGTRVEVQVRLAGEWGAEIPMLAGV